MAATAYYQNKERAFSRTNRIHREINRASAYILDTDGPSTYTLGSAGRASSLTRDAPRYVDPSNSGYRFKDKLSTESFRRTKNVPISSTHQGSSNLSTSPRSGPTPKAYPKDFNPYSETARYKREQEMKDIHNDFMKNWSTQQSKLSGSEEKKSKAYHKIMGTAVSALEDRDFTRQTIGDIFKDMSKFSTKTVAALSTLDTNGPNNKNKNYNWRKEIEKYETTGQLERDARIRNIEIRNKRTTNDLDTPPIVRPLRRKEPVEIPETPSPPKKNVVHLNISRIASERKVEIPAEQKKGEEKVSKSLVDVRPQEPTEKEEDNNDVKPEEPAYQPKKRTTTIKKKVIKKKAAEPKVPEEPEENKVDEDLVVSPDAEPVKESKEEPDAEEEDIHGTKKMKEEFSERMASLDAEMTAGRSNLARIRERIRKAKQGLMAVEI